MQQVSNFDEEISPWDANPVKEPRALALAIQRNAIHSALAFSKTTMSSIFRRDKYWALAAVFPSEPVSIETRPAGSGSVSCHKACEHHQAVMGTKRPTSLQIRRRKPVIEFQLPEAASRH